MAAHTHDDGFHEIQLNGKQLVFLFMAATVASVVIFLCGVMVGRGVRAERATVASAQEVEQPPTADVAATADAAATVAPPPNATDDSIRVNPNTAPPQPVDDLTDKEKKDSDARVTAAGVAAATVAGGPAAEIKPTAVTKPAAPPVVAKKPVVEPEKKPAAPQVAVVTPPAIAASSAPPGSGFTVQVAALDVRSEADAIAKRLSSKGYSAYVQSPPGSASVFRVRVGAYKTRREAESVASKLQKEEQFKPWVTR